MSTNQIIYAFGAGRDPQTKAARRIDRFSDRTFRIGSDVIIRPGRRIPVTVGYISTHLDEVINHIERGALRLQSDSNSFIEPAELRALVRGEPMPAKMGPGEDEFPEDPHELPAEEVPSDPMPEEPVEAEMSSEPAPVSAEPAVEETAAEPEVAVMSAPETSSVELPDGWRSRSKKGLLALAQEHNVEANDKMSNREIILALEALEK